MTREYLKHLICQLASSLAIPNLVTLVKKQFVSISVVDLDPYSVGI